MKLLRILLVLSVFSTILLACGADQATPSSGSDTQPSPVMSSPQPDPEAVTPEPEAGAAEASPATSGDAVVIYSGRSENLVKPLLDMFTADTGIPVAVRYGDTAEMAAQILEEGDNSPADVFYGQDAGALGALSERFTPLEESILNQVEARFRSPNGTWVGTSGRARVLVYNTTTVQPADLPASVLDLTDAKWRGRIGWAPTNGSFQAFVTALRITQSDEVARTWLEAMIANDVKVYEKNSAIVNAVASGEIDAGLVNHYYLFALKKDRGDVAAQNYYFPNGDVGSLVNVAGAGILKTGKHQAQAHQFIDYLLSPKAQQYFADQTFEYPLISGVQPNPEITPLAEIATPNIDLGNLQDLQGTLEMLQDVGALQ